MATGHNMLHRVLNMLNVGEVGLEYTTELWTSQTIYEAAVFTASRVEEMKVNDRRHN